MRKKKSLVSLIGAVALGLSVYAGYHTYDVNTEINDSDLLLANIEALAVEGESGSEPEVITCYSSFMNRGYGDLNVKDCHPCGTPVTCVGCFDKSTCKVN